MIEFFETGKIELYDLNHDINESHNLEESMPQKVSELHQLLMDWRKKVNAQMPSPNPNYNPERESKWGQMRKTKEQAKREKTSE